MFKLNGGKTQHNAEIGDNYRQTYPKRSSRINWIVLKRKCE